MRKIVEQVEGEGLDSFLGERVVVFCANYIYSGLLAGVNATCILLHDASIVYETGQWSAAKWADAQPMGPGAHYVRIQWIESFRKGK